MIKGSEADVGGPGRTKLQAGDGEPVRPVDRGGGGGPDLARAETGVDGPAYVLVCN